MSKPDWFKIYPSKLLQDSLVDGMTTEELGCAFRLLCRQWIDGSIPDDLAKIARLCRVDANRMGDLWVTLSEWFPSVGDGQRANRYMFVERDIVEEKMDKKSDEGYKAARKRWDAVRKMRDAQPMPNPLGDPMQEKRVESTEKITDAPKAASPSRARSSAKKDEIPPIPEDLFPFLEELSAKWYKKSHDGRRVTRLTPAETWKRICRNREQDSPGTCINAGMYYLELNDNNYAIGMDNFFGKERKYTRYVVEG